MELVFAGGKFLSVSLVLEFTPGVFWIRPGVLGSSAKPRLVELVLAVGTFLSVPLTLDFAPSTLLSPALIYPGTLFSTELLYPGTLSCKERLFS